jgi:nucleoid-associated protein YgaU
MFLRGSRYATARPFTAGFRGVRPRDIGPAEGVLEHTVRLGDRLDRLARHYYNDDRLWWRILDANPEILFGSDLDAATAAGATGELDRLLGRVIVIPRAVE